jgi:hypothetical protein
MLDLSTFPCCYFLQLLLHSQIHNITITVHLGLQLDSSLRVAVTTNTGLGLELLGLEARVRN